MLVGERKLAAVKNKKITSQLLLLKISFMIFKPLEEFNQ